MTWRSFGLRMINGYNATERFFLHSVMLNGVQTTIRPAILLGSFYGNSLFMPLKIMTQKLHVPHFQKRFNLCHYCIKYALNTNPPLLMHFLLPRTSSSPCSLSIQLQSRLSGVHHLTFTGLSWLPWDRIEITDNTSLISCRLAQRAAKLAHISMNVASLPD